MVRRLLSGLSLVVVGAILLMNTTGYLPWEIWLAALNYWPALLIGLGIQVALSQWRVPGLAISVIVILILATINPYAGAGSALSRWGYQFGSSQNPTPEVKDVQVGLEQGVSSLRLDLDAPAMDVLIAGNASLGDEDSVLALAGKLGWDRYEPGLSSSAKGGEISASVRTSVPVNTPQSGKQEWTFGVNPALFTSVSLEGGVVNLELDATELYVSEVSVSAGVTKLSLKMGLSGKETRIQVSGGVSNLSIAIPEAAGLRIAMSGGLTTRDFSEEGLVKAGNAWLTPDYESAATKLDVTVSSGIAKAVIVRTGAAL